MYTLWLCCMMGLAGMSADIGHTGEQFMEAAWLAGAQAYGVITSDRVLNKANRHHSCPDRCIIEESIIDIDKCTSYDYRYPQFGIPSIDRDLRYYVYRKYVERKSLFSETMSDPDDADQCSSEVSGSYQVTYNADDGIDILFWFSEYASGAAHPSSWFETRMYDRKTGRRILPREFFKKPADALSKLRTSVCGRLIRYEERECLDRGDCSYLSSPMCDYDEENTLDWDDFSSMVRTPDSIRFYFGHYSLHFGYADGRLMLCFPRDYFD